MNNRFYYLKHFKNVLYDKFAMSKYYVYVDYTLENSPRPFYVGKGNLTRVNNKHRNFFHQKISNQYGINRVIEFETFDENQAFQKEIELIVKYHTFYKDKNYNQIGSNLTQGGEGVSNINNRQVIQCDKDDKIIKIFDSIKDVAIQFNIDPTSLSNAFSNRAQLPILMQNFNWIVEKNRRKITKQNHKNAFKIIASLDDNSIEEYESLTYVCDKFNIQYKLLSNALRGNQKSINKLKQLTNRYWKFKDIKNISIKQKSPKKDSQTASKPVKLTNKITNEIKEFISLSSAAIFLNICVDQLMKAIYNHNLINDFICEFIHEKDYIKRKISFRSNEYRQKISQKNGTKLVCTYQSGELIYFNSFHEAEVKFLLPRGKIWNAIKKFNKFITQDGAIITLKF